MPVTRRTDPTHRGAARRGEPSPTRARIAREMRDALQALQALLRAARRQAGRHARAGRLVLAARFESHGRLLAAAVAAMRLEMGPAGATRIGRSGHARG